jgi:hypothetical protein
MKTLNGTVGVTAEVIDGTFQIQVAAHANSVHHTLLA